MPGYIYTTKGLNMSTMVILAASLVSLASLLPNESVTLECGMKRDGNLDSAPPVLATLHEDGSLSLAVDSNVVAVPKESVHLLHSMKMGQSYVMRVHIGPQEGAVPMVRTQVGLELDEFMPIGEPSKATDDEESESSTAPAGDELASLKEENGELRTKLTRTYEENSALADKVIKLERDLAVKAERESAYEKELQQLRKVVADRPTQPGT